MKTLSLHTVAALTIVFSAYTGCSPKQSQTTSAVTAVESTSSNIVGGKLSTQKFQNDNGVVGLAIIMTDTLGQQSMATCTGTLIDRRVVLTAAHCLAGDSMSQVSAVAVYFKPSLKLVKKGEAIFADKALAHPDFLKGLDEENVPADAIWNDVALVRLSEDAPSDVQLAKLPLKSDDIKIDSTSKVTLTGFGVATAIVNKKKRDPRTGQIVVVPVREKVPSSGILRQIDNVAVVSVTADNKEIKLDQRNSKGACHGDSGGPAFLKLADGSQVQVGVTSRGTEELGNCNQFAIYTDLIGHSEWIQDSLIQILK